MMNLRDRFRQAAMLLVDRLEKARNRALTPPEWCFKLAQCKHKAGHYAYYYDKDRDAS